MTFYQYTYQLQHGIELRHQLVVQHLKVDCLAPNVFEILLCPDLQCLLIKKDDMLQFYR